LNFKIRKKILQLTLGNKINYTHPINMHSFLIASSLKKGVFLVNFLAILSKICCVADHGSNPCLLVQRKTKTLYLPQLQPVNRAGNSPGLETGCPRAGQGRAGLE